jgi:acetoin utilization deacetylase AcuC-like enzyme
MDDFRYNLSKSKFYAMRSHRTVSKPAFFYSDKYYADIGRHVFPIKKYRLIREKLISEGIISESDILQPRPATKEELLLVHTSEYIEDLTQLRWTHRTSRSELPLTQEIADAYILATGGTILASEKAFADGIAINLGGGFHHGFPDHGEGFCYINDIAVGIRKLKADRKIQKAAVIDCDVHQGNGTAVIFQDDPNVFTFSIHQEHNYPVKEVSDLDIGLDDFSDDATYLNHISQAVPEILDIFKPKFVSYIAGADPYRGDQLGGLSLSIEGLKRRDEIVIGECRQRKVPVVILLAGGYAIYTEDTVTIHCNTCKVALETVDG